MLFATGCANSNKVNLLEYKRNVTTKIYIPEICKAEYKNSLPRVAVIDWTNNSTFGIAEVNQGEKSSTAGFAIGVTPTFAGAVAGTKTKNYNEKRTIDAKLSKAIVPTIENMILNFGGAKIYTRNDIDKIKDELKFQDSGLLDSKSIVKFQRRDKEKILLRLKACN